MGTTAAALLPMLAPALGSILGGGGGARPTSQTSGAPPRNPSGEDPSTAGGTGGGDLASIATSLLPVIAPALGIMERKYLKLRQ